MKNLLAIAALLFSVTAAANDAVNVHDITFVNFGNNHSVSGFATNTGNEALHTLEVDFKFYDKDGNVVGNATAMGKDIGPRETYKFSSPTLVDFVRVEVTNVIAR